MKTEYQWISPSPVARRLLWHLLGIGFGRYDKTRRWEPLDKPGAVLLWIETGAGRLELGPESYQLEAGPRFWLLSLKKPRVFTPAKGTVFIAQTIRFSGPSLEVWLEELDVTQNPEFGVTPSWATHVYSTQARLLRLVNNRPPHWEARIHALLGSLLMGFLTLRNVLNPDEPLLPEPITRALDAIEADPFRDWKVGELATCAGLNSFSFGELFRRHMRETVHEHLQHHRVDLAQAFLADPRSQIKWIAKRLHFKSDHYFSHFFRQKTGMTPTEFRNHLGGPNRKK